jgi:hypothetical protein
LNTMGFRYLVGKYVGEDMMNFEVKPFVVG